MKYGKIDKVLLKSIQTDDFGQVKALVEQWTNINFNDPAAVDINATDVNGYSLIFGLKEPRAIKFLVKCGAQVNVKSKDGFSPLCLAVGRNRLDTAKALLDAGADVNYRICHDGTALFFCKTIKMLKLLIEYRADINVKNDYGYMVTETTPYKKIAKYINSLHKNGVEKANKKGDKQ